MASPSFLHHIHSHNPPPLRSSWTFLRNRKLVPPPRLVLIPLHFLFPLPFLSFLSAFITTTRRH
jgi:hypothetical protein